MTAVTAEKVKELRQQTGAGMLDCKKALDETKGNMEQAIDWLRKKGLSAALKKSGRIAAEGLVAAELSADQLSGAVVEINAETDFVARNDLFQQLVEQAVRLVLTKGDDTNLLTEILQDDINKLIATIGEHMNFRRAKKLSVKQGLVCSYVHAALKPKLGKIAVLVALESTADKTKLAELGKQLALHIAAASPSYLNETQVPKTVEQREREIFTEQAKASGKPENVIAKMVEGRIKKFYQESVLLKQTSVLDGETEIAQLIENTSKAIAAPIAVTDFVLFRLGAGLEKKQDDFAAEVKAMAGN